MIIYMNTQLFTTQDYRKLVLISTTWRIWLIYHCIDTVLKMIIRIQKAIEFNQAILRTQLNKCRHQLIYKKVKKISFNLLLKVTKDRILLNSWAIFDIIIKSESKMRLGALIKNKWRKRFYIEAKENLDKIAYKK